LITCLIRYTVDLGKISDFEQYARTWMDLIEKYGGTHHGYFVPHDSPPAATFSFSVGEEGASNIAVALFSFPTIEAYEKYRSEVSSDPNCVAEARHRDEAQIFTKYERTFLRPVRRD
jgi:hypothetical protein